MSTTFTWNGVSYTIPAVNDVSWGAEVTKFLLSLPNNTITKDVGAWHLTTADLDLGSSYGMASLYVKSKTATIASSGFVRMAKTDTLGWKNNAGSGNNILSTASDLLKWNTVEIPTISSASTLTNKTIDADLNTLTHVRSTNLASDAGLTYSQLALSDGDIPWEKVVTTGKVTNASISSDPGDIIAGSKVDTNFGTATIITAGGVKLGGSKFVTLQADPDSDYSFTFPDADGTTGQTLVRDSNGDLIWASVPGLALIEHGVMIGNASALPESVDTSSVGEILADETNGFTIKNTVINNAMVKTDAAIALSKLAAVTASRAVVSDASGFASASATTAAEIGYVSGVTSAIQTQLGTKVVGPASAVDSNFAGFDTVTGKLIKDSGSKAADFAATSHTHPYAPAAEGVTNGNTHDHDGGDGAQIDHTKLSNKGTNTHAQIDTTLASSAAAITATQEPTGFEDPANIIVTYDSSTQIVTLTRGDAGAIYYWVAGVRLSISSGWTSTAHANTVGHYYWLSINGSGASVWTTDASPGFNSCLIANILYYTAYKFGIKECHGLMQWQTHKELHATIGTYRSSGGSAVAASYAATTNTIAAVTPDVDAAVINDEDLTTTVAAFAAADGYTQLYFDTGAPVFVIGAALPYIVTGTASAGNPKYNQNPLTGTALTDLTTNNRYFNIYTIFVPVTADAGSQAYRMMWLTGQAIYTSLTAAASEDFRTLALGTLRTVFGEFMPYVRWSMVKTGSNLTYNAQIAADPTYLLGTAASLVSVSGFNPTDHNTLTGRSDADSHPASAITGTAVTLAGVEALTNKDIDGGTASNTSRLTIPKASTATLAGLTRKEATIVYDTTAGKAFIDDGSALKVVGGGLIITPVDHTATTLVDGRHYIVDMTGASTDITLTLPAGTSEASISISVVNNVGAYKVTVDANAAEEIWFDGVAYTDVYFPEIRSDQWAKFNWNTIGTDKWTVDTNEATIGGTLYGNLGISGTLTVDGMVTASTKGIIAPYNPTTPIGATTQNGNIYSGTYTPISSNLVNLGSVTMRGFNYMRVGNVVFVTGTMTLAVTTTNVDTYLSLSLPLSTSNFSSAYNAQGVSVATASATGAKDAGSISADSGAKTVSMEWQNITVGTGANGTAYVSFSYIIIP